MLFLANSRKAFFFEPRHSLDIFIMRGKGICGIVPLFRDHPAGRIVGRLHRIAVCIGDPAEPAAAVFVVITDKLIRFAV